MPQQYVSKFTGVQIDRAVAYSLANAPRTVVKANITTSNWQDSSSIAKYKINLSMNSSFNLGSINFVEPPMVYFLDGDNLKWDIEYACTFDQSDNNAVTNIIIYSNTKIAGKVVASGVLSGIPVSSVVPE